VSKLTRALDPRRSIATAVGWLAAALSLTVAVVTVWGGNIARYHLLSKRDAALTTAAETLSVELDQGLSFRLQSLESLRAIVSVPVSAGDTQASPALRTALDHLRSDHPEFEWIGLADMAARLVAQTAGSKTPQGDDDNQWISRCLHGPWFGDLQRDAADKVFGLCAPIVDGDGRTVALAAAHLPQSWMTATSGQVRDRLNLDRRARMLVLDDGQHVLIDNRASPTSPLRAGSGASEVGPVNALWTPNQVSLQPLDGKRHVVVRARRDENSTLHRLGLQVLVMQPSEEAVWQGGGIQQQIAWISLAVSVAAALIGIGFARGLTRRLTNLTVAVKRGDTDAAEWIDAPPGKDEVAELGHAFGVLLDTLRHERDGLNTLAAEQELRVQARTAEVRQQARYLRTLIDMLPMWAWFKDTEGRFLAVNQAAAATLDLSTDELVGKTDFDLHPREHAEAFRAGDVEVMTSRRQKTMEEPQIFPTGKIWLEVFKAPVIDEDGTVLGTVGVARDISEHKAVEAARETALSEATRLAHQRSEFLALMSHELRTPLNGILGFAQILLRDKSLTDRQMRGLKIIDECGQQLLTLINDILDLARIDAAKLELAPTVVNLPTFLQVVCDIIRVKAEEKSLLLVYHAAPDLPANVRIDEKRLRQVLLNLLSNAVKFTDAGQVTLRVTRLRPPTAGDDAIARLRFEVEDQGIGMSETQLARLFHPFEQVADLKRREGGTGLGLAISRQLIRLMGGDIQVRSGLGEGSVFWFELEVPAPQLEGQAKTKRGMPVGYQGIRRKILVVDDVPQGRAMLLDALGMLGFEMADACNGEEALAVAARFRPDLVVMDVMMPVMNGLEATRRLRLSPESAKAAVVSVSANASAEAHSREAGADAFVVKPIELPDLLNAIAAVLELTWIREDPTPREQQSS